MRGNILLIAAAIFVISLLVTLNLFFTQNYQAETAEQLSKQQLVLAETISRDIQRSIRHLKNDTVVLARVLADYPFEKPGFERLIKDAFLGKMDDMPLALKVYRSDGSLAYRSNPRAAIDSDRSAIEMVAAASEVRAEVFENPYEWGVSFATPVLNAAGRHKGTLVLDISIEAITSRFLLPVKIAGPSNAWMMDQNGTLLFHPTMPEMVGKNLYRADPSCFDCHTSFEVEKRILDSGQTAVQSYVAPFGEDKIIASSKVTISESMFWITLVSIPYSEVTASIRKSTRLHSILIVAIFGATAAAAFTLVVFNRKRLHAEEKARHEAELEHYAQELEAAVEKRTMELISEKEKLNAIVSAMDVGLFLADHDKNVIWINKTLRDWLGEAADNLTLDYIYAGKEVQGTTADDRLVQEIVSHTLGRRKGFFQITSTTLVGPDGNMQLLGLINDITEMKKAEEQMAHSEKLASLGRLTAGIAHEIGNPLTSVSSFLQILRERETGEFEKESLDTIMFHITRIADTVRQLSVMSKLPPAELKKVQVNELVESSLDLLKFDKRAKALDVSKELSDLPETYTDGNQLSQVFVNLILNAVDAMPDGGNLAIRSYQDAESISVEFQDTGPGIEAENLKRVFDPFYTTKAKGTGLGLSVSYGIIKRLGGDMAVTNVKPTGAVFTVTIPKREHGQDTRS